MISIDGYNILIDYGAIQDNSKSIEELYKINQKDSPVCTYKIDKVLVTHGHFDHLGNLCNLVRDGYKGDILCTAPTLRIMELSLYDSLFIQTRETEKYNKRNKKNKLYPSFTNKTVSDTLDLVKGYDYNRKIVLTDNITVEFLPNGHLIGSSAILIEARDEYEVKRILFTGDTSGDKKIPFTKKLDIEGLKINYLISEGTYGGKPDEINTTEQQIEEYLMKTCFQRRGTIVIPVFSFGRSTTVLHYVKQVYDRCPEFNKIPVYLASPLANKSHRLYGEPDSFNFYDEKWKDYKDLWKWDKVNYIDSFDEVLRKLDNNKPKIILASSGMISGGFSNYLVSRFVADKRNSILLCGYQGNGCAGRVLLDGKQKEVNIDGKNVKICAKVEKLKGLSGHISGKKLCEIFNKTEKRKLRKIILTHGDENELYAFKDILSKTFDRTDVIIPNYKQIVKLN